MATTETRTFLFPLLSTIRYSTAGRNEGKTMFCMFGSTWKFCFRVVKRVKEKSPDMEVRVLLNSNMPEMGNRRGSLNLSGSNDSLKFSKDYISRKGVAELYCTFFYGFLFRRSSRIDEVFRFCFVYH